MFSAYAVHWHLYRCPDEALPGHSVTEDLFFCMMTANQTHKYHKRDEKPNRHLDDEMFLTASWNIQQLSEGRLEGGCHHSQMCTLFLHQYWSESDHLSPVWQIHYISFTAITIYGSKNVYNKSILMLRISWVAKRDQPKYLHSVFSRRISYRVGMTWEWIHDKVFIFGWYHFKISRTGRLNLH